MGPIHLVLLLSTLTLTCCQSTSIDCTFQYNLCGWQSEPPWLLTDRTFLPSLLNLSPVLLIGDNAFMTAQGHFGSNSTADLTSPVMPPSPTLQVLSFKYTKVIGDANLQIMIKDGSVYRNLDTITSNSLVFWIRRSLVIPTTLEPYQIVFRASRLRTGFDVISVDDIMLRTASRAVLSADDNLKLSLLAPSEIREMRRSPTPYRRGNITSNLHIKTQCSLVKCSFKENPCFWTFENWKLLNGKIVTESQPKAWLSTEPVLLPMNAHFELDVLSSGSAIISVHQEFGNDEILIWTQSGLTLVGWNRIRLPIRFSPLPSRLLIRTSTQQGQFVAITNTNIVDESGRDLACGGDMLVIRPRRDEVIRLTAMQKLDSSQVESSTIPTLFMVSTSTSAVSSLSALPSPSGYRPPVVGLSSISSPGHVVPSPLATLPISPAQVSSRHHQSTAFQALRARPSLFSVTSANTTRTSSSILRNRTTFPIPISAVTKTTSSIENLLASLKGQPIFDGQLKYLAKKFGLDRMSDDEADVQRYRMIQRMLGALQHIKTSSADQKPISPTNTKDDESSVLPEELTRFASSIPQTINGALTNKISQFISPPRDIGDDSKPFSRNNMDYVVQNAYNAYINQARP